MLLHLSPDGANFIKSHEGLSLVLYRDSGGRLTIGYGHLVLPGENFSKGITQEEADALFTKDAFHSVATVSSLVRVLLNQNEADATISLFYNIGQGNFTGSTFLRRLNRKDFSGAAEALLWWCYSGEPPKLDTGLLNRRRAEKKLFDTPEKAAA